MSDQDEARPLTRRERRMREMAETGALNLSEVNEAPPAQEAALEGGASDAGVQIPDQVAADQPGSGVHGRQSTQADPTDLRSSEPQVADPTGAAASSEAPAAADPDDIEISPYNEDGSPRSRREIRQLREEALARLGGGREEEPPAAAVMPEAPVAAVDPEPPVSEPQPETPETTETAESEQAAGDLAESAPEAEAPAQAEPLAQAEPPAQTEASAQAESPAAVEEEIPADGEQADAHTEPDFDMLITPPTEAFTIDELREAEQVQDDDRDGQLTVAEEADAAGAEVLAQFEAEQAERVAQAEQGFEAEQAAPLVDATESVPPAVPLESDGAPEAPGEAEAAAAEKPKRRFWNRGKTAAAAPVDDAPETDTNVDAAQTTALPVSEDPAQAAEYDANGASAPTVAFDAVAAESQQEPAQQEQPQQQQPEPVQPEPVQPEPAFEPVQTAEPALAPDPEIPLTQADLPSAAPDPEAPVSGQSSQVPANEPAQPQPAQSATESYSFPDIAPPEEWRSVFDDQSTSGVPVRGTKKPDGDFDDLISRAVAQESTTSSNTSALILPTMPEDTGGLTGPLGATGDMFITGSLKLPKSLGETGGHAGIHDSLDVNAMTGQYDPPAPQPAQSAGPAPVAARQAVSAQGSPSVPVVAEPTKERSKMPLVLSLTGGGLLVAVIGIGAFGFANGWFG